MDDYGQAALNHLVHPHKTGVVEVDLLRVGMDFHALEAKFDGSLDLLFRIGVVLVHGHEPGEFGMPRAFRRDE